VQTVRRNGIVVSQSRTFTNITGRVEVFTAGGNDKVTATNMTSISVFVDGGAGNDVIFGGRAADTILGGDGNDTISGSKGADLIRGGEGDDQIYGEYAASASLGSRRADMSSDTIYGEGGNDFIYGDSDGGEGQGDYIDAGDGDDTVIADGSTGHRSANDTVFGGAGNDLIFGDSIEASATNGGSDQLEGGSGNDIIYAGGGSDVVRGGTGSDLIIADRLGSLTLQAMQAIRQEWNSSRTLAQRRDNITGRNFTGLNGSNFIVPTVHFLNANVFDDQAVDGAFAGAGDGAGDWLIVTSGQDQSNEAGSEDLIDLVLNT
jgi:Ca2+-binding RTX toxin-like protein